MRHFSVIALMYFFCYPANAQELSAEMAVGDSLVSAIVTNDVVAYSQCWISSRRMATMMKDAGVDLPASAATKMREYHTLRNQDIVESFRKIQALIDDSKIDRQSIRLKTCEASNIREKKAPKGTVTQASGFNLVLTVGDKEWRYRIDDGVKDNGMWYFSDSPTNLFTDGKTLSFRDHRAKK